MTYDAILVAAAAKCRAERNYTFNVDQFRSLADADFAPRITSPYKRFPQSADIMPIDGEISWPLVGFRSISQISPRFGCSLVLIEIVAFGHTPVLLLVVVLLQLVGLRLEDSPALFEREL